MASSLNQDESTKTAIEVAVVDGSLVEWTEKELIRWDNTKQVTELAPSLQEWIQRAKTTQGEAMKLIEAMRTAAQPNPAFRGKRLVPGDKNKISDRMAFANMLPDFAKKAFSNQPALIEYAEKLAKLEARIDEQHEIFLRQVMIYSVQPITEIATKFFPKLLKAYESMLNARDRYDAKRRKGSHGNIAHFRNELEETAHVLLKLLVEVPRQQVAITEAIDCYRRAEMDFGQKVQKVGENFVRPSWLSPRSRKESQ